MPMTPARSTTILSVRRDDQVAIGGDGQVTLGAIVAKHDAVKIRRIGGGKVLTGIRGIGRRRVRAAGAVRKEAQRITLTTPAGQ